eukprot:TRINITY_DN27215_c0_g1_i1.p1 TRINITY_DN27215_c0_g1~~TRINITY_DN27215_c0_g1_i1.p1  ORF type:complete len:595 (+),score=64.68 TRINITY_DN27215_c0_g1_i1:88-1872(+)
MHSAVLLSPRQWEKQWEQEEKLAADLLTEEINTEYNKFSFVSAADKRVELNQLYQEAQEMQERKTATQIAEAAALETKKANKRAAITAPTEEQRRTTQLRVAFKKWDQEGDNKIAVDELVMTMQSNLVPDDPELTECILQRMKELGENLEKKNVTALDPAAFVEACLWLTSGFVPDQFNKFVQAILSMRTFLSELTPLRKRSQAIWRLFNQWDANGSGSLEYNELEAVVSNTPFFEKHNIGVREIVNSFWTGEPLPDDPKEFDEFVQAVQKKNPSITLQQFHKFINSLLIAADETEFYDAMRQVGGAVAYQRRKYVINRHLERPNSADRNGPLTAEMGDIQDTEYDLTLLRIKTHRKEIEHAFDAVNVHDLEKITETKFTQPYFEITAAPVCILLNVSPMDTATGEYQYWTAMKWMLINDATKFLQNLMNFDSSKVTYTQIKRVTQYYYNPRFDSNRMLMHSWFFSALTTWVKGVVHIVCLENDWECPPRPFLGRAADATTDANPNLQTAQQLVLDKGKKQKKEGRLPILPNVLTRHEPRKMIQLTDDSPFKNQQTFACTRIQQYTPRPPTKTTNKSTALSAVAPSPRSRLVFA